MVEVSRISQHCQWSVMGPNKAVTHLSLLGWPNFEAATTSAFSSFLRCKEFMIHLAREFNPTIHITRSCIQFRPSISDPLHVILTVPSWTPSGKVWQS